MIRLRKLVYFAITLGVFYYLFIVNIWITLGVIAALYLALRLYKINVKNKLRKISTSKESFRESELGLFIGLVAKVAKADGRVDEFEAQLIGIMFDDIASIFENKEKTKVILKEIFNEEKEREDNTKEIAQALNKLLGRSLLKRQQYLGFLIQLASVGDGMSSDEERVLAEIVTELHISPEQYKEILTKFQNMLKNKQQSMSLAQAAKILGVNEDDDMSLIKKSYRKLIRQYHPDIVKSQDKDASYMEKATAKTQEINQAYEVIKEARK